MRNIIFLAIMSIITVTNLHASQAGDNFKNCNPRLSSEELIFWKVADCLENPMDKGCGKLMASLRRSSNAYWLWPSSAQKKAAQIVAEYDGILIPELLNKYF